jgi:hypothetical protein
MNVLGGGPKILFTVGLIAERLEAYAPSLLAGHFNPGYFQLTALSKN